VLAQTGHYQLPCAGIQADGACNMIAPFSFNVGKDVLYGIQHDPLQNAAQHWSVIFLSGPGTNRCGPHRLHLAIAEALEKDGISSFRFDFRGRGESQGDPSALNVHSMMEDLLVMLEYIKKERPLVQHCIIIANCLSCVAALKVFEAGSMIQSCILLGAQELHDGTILRTRLAELAGIVTKYTRKLARPATWKKLFRNQVSYKQVRRSFTNIFPSHYVTKDQAEKKRIISLLPSQKDNAGSKSVLFIYGESDPLKKELDYYRAYSKKHRWDFEAVVLPDADRTFRGRKASAEVLNRVRTFIRPVLQTGNMEFQTQSI
jgi:alpha/beta superfamily hydrolase